MKASFMIIFYWVLIYYPIEQIALISKLKIKNGVNFADSMHLILRFLLNLNLDV